MLIGLAGKPSSGKSTFFSAATLIDVPISPRPFTTINPNKGITYIKTKCPCSELNLKCNPKNSKCENGVRLIPINIVDLAGLVPGAHEGRGLGNRFLDDVRTADILIQIVDVSGKTDSEGNPTEFYDPANEIIFLEDEISYWINGILKRGWSKIKGRDIESIFQILSGLKLSKSDIVEVCEKLSLSTECINWSEEETLKFSREIRKISMPIIIAANKIDLEGAEKNLISLKKKFPDKIIIPTYADGELALRKANAKGIIKYSPGNKNFEICTEVKKEQKEALDRIKKVMEKYGSTGVQEAIEKAFAYLNLIVVYPVNDENKFTDHLGNVLPDAIILRDGSTTLELAEKIHSDLAKNFLFAIDARKKTRVGKDHLLKNGDIIKIVAAK